MVTFAFLVFASALPSAITASEFSFRTDILPILTKAGCNAGACHGTSTGQGGFRLSLLGYNPEEDFWTITREFQGRRIEIEAPAESLFLKKPTHQLEHEGGRRIRRDSEEYRVLVDWIKQGAQFGSREQHVTSIEVRPADQLLQSPDDKLQLQVTAHLSDGSVRDVTELALYTSNDEGIAEVDKSGLVSMRGRGPTSVMIRFGGQVSAARVAVPFNESEPDISGFISRNFIDDEILAELKRLRIAPAPLSKDGEFLRRVYLDLTGRLPEHQIALRFTEKPQTQAARSDVINRLLGSEAFVDYWTFKLADLLLISGKRGSQEATKTYYSWLREQVSENAPWDKFARQLISATGDISKAGPPNFYMIASDPRDIAEHVGTMFLGVQIGCARCHAHPSDRWTQEDYYDFSAFFTRVSRNENTIDLKDSGEIDYPVTKKPAHPKPLGGSRLEALDKVKDRRELLAHALTNDPLFARSMVNRVWKNLFGSGLIEPVDDLRPTNPASHPVLLEKLSAEFVRHGFDLRWLIKTIVLSQTYQLSSEGVPFAAGSERLFARGSRKHLPAQVLVDAISQVTGVTESFDGVKPGTTAVQLVGTQTPSYALDVLGRCGRERNCETVNVGGGLAQALHLINGSTVNEKINGGTLNDLVSKGKTNSEIVRDLYLRALTRLPSDVEEQFWSRTLNTDVPRREALEDFLWTLLNCREFAYNH